MADDKPKGMKDWIIDEVDGEPPLTASERAFVRAEIEREKRRKWLFRLIHSGRNIAVWIAAFIAAAYAIREGLSNFLKWVIQ